MSTLATEQTNTLIGSDKVEGTAVYNSKREKLGAVYNFMVDKRSGKVQYAVLQFGGFLGVGTDYYPLPWNKLNYSVEQGGYVVDIDKDVLTRAPHYHAAAEPTFDRAYGEQVHGAYGMPYPAI